VHPPTSWAPAAFIRVFAPISKASLALSTAFMGQNLFSQPSCILVPESDLLLTYLGPLNAKKGFLAKTLANWCPQAFNACNVTHGGG